MPDLALLSISGPIATLSLSRPDARNALSIDLLANLSARAAELAQRQDVTILILAGEGKSFCAGMDLKAVTSSDGIARGLPLQLLTALADFTLQLRQLPQVTIAKVNGAAVGGGCGLACVADLCITHADSKMGFPEVDLGVCPAVVAPWLVRKVGAGRARAILLRGGLMTGQQAHEAGIATQVVPTIADLDAATAELAQRLATGGPNALRATKTLLNELDQIDQPLLHRAAQLSAQVLTSPEAQAMLRAKLG
jgi:enoyl-CoA hydratase/carnithine racemase